jgi:hypothetical protein
LLPSGGVAHLLLSSGNRCIALAEDLDRMGIRHKTADDGCNLYRKKGDRVAKIREFRCVADPDQNDHPEKCDGSDEKFGDANLKVSEQAQLNGGCEAKDVDMVFTATIDDASGLEAQITAGFCEKQENNDDYEDNTIVLGYTICVPCKPVASVVTRTVAKTTTTITTPTTTTTTKFPMGKKCDANSECASNSCNVHCCTPTTLPTDCWAGCSSITGECFATLKIDSDVLTWNKDTVADLEWPTLLNTGVFEQKVLAAPPKELISAIRRTDDTNPDDASLQYDLRWSPLKNRPGGTEQWTLPSDYFIGRSPPSVLAATSVWPVDRDQGADPGGVVSVDRTDGTITAIPKTPGDYTMWLLVRDQTLYESTNKQLSIAHGLSYRAGTMVVARWDIKVEGKDPFKVISYDRDLNVDLDKYTVDKSPSLTCVVGSICRISSIINVTTANGYDDGENKPFNAITLKGAPIGFFIEASTGEILGSPSTATPADNPATASLWLVDALGNEAFVETIQITVNEPKEFALTRNLVQKWEDVGLKESKGDGVVNEDVNIQYAVGSTIEFPSLNQNFTDLFTNPADDDFDKIGYKRKLDQNPGLWMVDTETGEMLATPTNKGVFNVQLLATDGAGAVVEVRRWSFEVLDKDTDVDSNGPKSAPCKNGGSPVDDVPFDNGFTCDCGGTRFEGDNCEKEIVVEAKQCLKINEALVGDECKAFQLFVENVRTDSAEFTNPDEITFYTVNTPYRFAPLEINAASSNYSSGDFDNIKYLLTSNTAGRDDTDGFFLNTKTGIMLGSFEDFDAKTETMTFNITLSAVDASGLRQDVETKVMNVRYEDDQVEVFGPNGRECNNGGKRNDTVPFDKRYTCDCVPGFTGDNCQTEPPQTSAATSTSSGGAIGASLGSIIGLLLLAFGVMKYLHYRQSMKPVDFKAEFEKMIASGAFSSLHVHDSKTPREIPRKCVTKSEKVGEGAFGEVFKAVLDESHHGGVPGYLVACKSVMDPSGDGAADLVQEAAVMAQVDSHINLVSLIGVVTSGTPLLLVIALCEHGSLKSQLEKRALGEGKLAAPQGGLPAKLDADIAVDIARGMHHLVEASLVHRDLAARNVLLDSALNAKVADFGTVLGSLRTPKELEDINGSHV